MLSFLTKSLWLSDSAIKTLEIWLFVPSVHQRQDQDQKYLALFLPSLHRHITNKMWFKKSSSVSTNHNWYLLVMCYIPFQILFTRSNEFETNFQKEALLALDILISYILRKILGGIGHKYDATSLQRL